MFNAILVRKDGSDVSYDLEKIDKSFLSEGDVLVKVFLHQLQGCAGTTI